MEFRLSPKVEEWLKECHGQGDGEMAAPSWPEKAGHIQGTLGADLVKEGRGAYQGLIVTREQNLSLKISGFPFFSFSLQILKSTYFL